MKQKTILITGGTAGIGLTLAKQLKSQGHQLIITGRNSAKLARIAEQLNCQAFVADSADLKQINNMAQSLIADGTAIDGLVLNAGVFQPRQFAEISETDFNYTLDINTKGPLFTLQALLPCLAPAASVVFVSSIAVNKGFEGCTVYAASKAATEAAIRVANIELAQHGIRINSVRPGVTATEIQGKAGMNQQQQQEFFQTLESTPLGRVMTPEDQIGAIEFLLSDASLAMRNAVIEVEGGYLL